MKVRRLVIAGVATAAALGATSMSVSAHDCFNPTKNANAPMAGVNWELVGFDSTGNPILVQVGTGQGNGGFIEIAAGVFGNPVPVFTHSLGAGVNPHGVVGGPGSQKPNHACDGKGIDYLDVCFGG